MKMHILKKVTAEYELLPKVVLTGRETEFSLRGLGIEREFYPGEAFTIRVIPQEQIATARTLKIGDEDCYEEVRVIAGTDRCVRFRLTLPREQIYTLRLLGAARAARGSQGLRRTGGPLAAQPHAGKHPLPRLLLR